MSDPITPATVYPERHTPEALAANAKPKRARKPKAATPKVEKPPRAKRVVTTPARTLRRRVDDLGPYFLEAFDRQRKKGGEGYEKEVRDALDARDQLATAKAKCDAARTALAEAATALVDAEKVELDSRPVLDHIQSAAKVLAGLDRDDVEPDAPAETRGDTTYSVI